MTNVEPPPRPQRRGFQTGRLEAFSDGVFAIAVTLLVLDIGVPSETPSPAAAVNVPRLAPG